MIIEAAIFLISVLFILVIFLRKPSGLPPGKWGLPVIGYLPSITERLSDVVRRLNNEYGKVFCARMGSRVFVFLSDAATIKATFGKAEFSDRFDLFTWKLYHNFKNKGIALADGLVWSTNRRFALKVLKDFGMGKSKLEETVNFEVSSLVQEFEAKVNTPVMIDWSLNVAVLNVTWGLVAEKRHDLKDKEICNFVALVEEIAVSLEGPANILNLFPWLIPYLPRFARKFLEIDQSERNRDDFIAYFKNIILEHKETLDCNKPRDYIDMYLLEMEEQGDHRCSETYANDYSDLIATVLEFFVAGSETTSSSIRWFILCMMKYPEMQKRIQQEIDSVVPRDRYPSLDDKEKLPYLEASIYESLRFATLVPLGVAHGAAEDTKINEYEIPKGTLIFPCIEICHRSAEYWERPNEFYPEHFLNAEGKFYIRKEGFLPFSLGRRQCLGESLAKMELFLFIGAMLQNFSISAPDGQSVNITRDPAIKIINSPRKLEVVLTKRF